MVVWAVVVIVTYHQVGTEVPCQDHIVPSPEVPLTRGCGWSALRCLQALFLPPYAYVLPCIAQDGLHLLSNLSLIGPLIDRTGGQLIHWREDIQIFWTKSQGLAKAQDSSPFTFPEAPWESDQQTSFLFTPGLLACYSLHEISCLSREPASQL